uniref:Uncharacterized protein n=1 Tax=Nicotiana tabacum TaxID=4097 RepID=Q9XLX7_TOBAC|nr:unknown [Nicotiana tabacum]
MFTPIGFLKVLRPLSPRLRGRVFSLLIFFGVLGFASLLLQSFGLNFEILLWRLHQRILVHLVVSRFGWYSGGFLLTMVFVGLDLENQMMMAPSGASGSGSGESAGGRGFRWTDLFGSSSPGNSEASLNQPAPDSPNPGEPAAPIAEVYHPLQEDGQRRRELSDRLSINTVKRPLPEDISEAIIETQLQTELKIEEALRSDRVQEGSILEKRHQIRGVLFYPFGRAFSLDTYLDHLKQIENQGTHRSLLYKRLMNEISQEKLELVFDGIKKRRDW